MTGTPIKREDIRKGDKIRSTFTEEFTASSNIIAHETGFTYELIERPVTLLTVPGAYLNTVNGLHYFLNECGDIWCLDNIYEHGGGGPYSPSDYNGADFNRLRPVAEVAAEVLADVRSHMSARSAFLADIDGLDKKWATND